MLYVVAFGADRAPLEHVLDPASPQRGQWAIERFLWRLRQFGQGSPRIAVVDWDWHTRAAGRRLYIDERLWYLGRMRLNPLGLATLSELLAAHITIQHTAGRKAIAVDLDNTLWGGVIGEDGLKDIGTWRGGRRARVRRFPARAAGAQRDRCGADDLQQDDPAGT